MIQARNKLMIYSVIAAAVSAFACLIPPLIILMFGASLISEIPAWLDTLLIFITIIFVVIAFFAWYRRKQSLRQSA